MNRSESKYTPGRVFFLGFGYCVFVLTAWLAIASLDSGNGGFVFLSLLVVLVIGFLGMKAFDAFVYRRNIAAGHDERKAKGRAAFATGAVFSVAGFVASMVVVSIRPTAFAQSPPAAAVAPTPTPGPCDADTLHKLNDAIGADILAGKPVGQDINNAAQAEDACSRYLPQGDASYRHILAEGNDYLLGIHSRDVNDKIGFMQEASASVAILLAQEVPRQSSDPSDSIRAQAQEITDTANEKIQMLAQ